MIKVMLVDDESTILIGLEHFIDWASLDCKITAKARNGQAAMNQIRQNPPDIVITDIRMPEMDGLRLAALLQEEFPQIKVIILTGFADFSYAQQAIRCQVVDFVLKPTRAEKMIEAVKKAKSQIIAYDDYQSMSQSLEDTSEENLRLQQNSVLKDLLYNGNTSENILIQIKECKLFLENYFVLFTAIYSTLPNCNYSEYQKQLEEIFTNCFSPLQMYCVPKGEKYLYLIVSAGEDCDLLNRCEKVLAKTDGIADYNLGIGISSYSDQVLNMHQCAVEAASAELFSEYAVETRVMPFERIPKLGKDDTEWIMNQLKLLENAIESQSRDSAMNLFDELIRFVKKQKIPISEMKRIYSIICSYCIEILFDFDVYSTFPKEAILTDEKLSEDSTLSEKNRKVEAFITQVMDALGKNIDSQEGIVYAVRKHIDERYKEDISLENLAEIVHVSPSYLSKLFRKKTGINISTYLQKVRVEHAKMLLKSSNMKTYEIAEAVGIFDPVYFSRMFKKVTGLKPKEYRAGIGGEILIK